ncbi:tRNA pseudouridine(55) synthase TruB [Flavobacteriales bacterium]|jgi:tRNA pseudouridine55 synthase|nr:tRNA pseudouridine(55) synthase TruB [Flavobacteriales bacterium]MDC3305669.1 tRNA pseudouridine(55) synthase TruB [Flavobacteriales bacterium]MDG1348578.1 tRNA pseudouridine(55) synthase TruB [Flavobacteriales bacterium]
MDKFPETVDDFLSGQILLINKPLGWTSFDVVRKIKNLIRTKYNLKKIKVGHAGTLDPLASGLLIVCTGKFTKRISELQGQAKIYTGDITLGGTTPSYDLETEVDKNFETSHITDELIKETTHQFTGEIYQKPPIFSALKRGGERLYEKARRGESIEIEARKVSINSFDITAIEMPKVSFEIKCSKGTYIRSIAHDFGTAIKSGGHLSKLCRTAIGNYQLANALDVDEFEKQLNS